MADTTETPAAPVEAKVVAASLTATVTSAVLWVLQTYVFGDASTPAPVVGLVTLLVTGVATFAAGYLARHTSRAETP